MNGRLSDGGVYWESDLSNAIEMNILNLPEDRPLPGRIRPVPYVIVADAAFSLSTHIMKPYPFRGLPHEQKIFNYRTSRARRIVKNTFGILANRFRILLHTIPLKPDKAKIIIQACCALHNFLRAELNKTYMGNNPDADIDRRYRFVYGLSRQQSRRPRTEALRIREEFKEYFNGCGSVPWQNDMICDIL
ncbi:hypothetical protein NQ317_017231 [Molorchus minor]|uniref:DDE Tnp4 domain-containing protein n=1 Tax=Molorchus minor TaxID=1323400 RepID=A0ABQ9JGM7_9CUCU|nr:hypothetical protein NQ317_017231 [Molorchus minor]